MESAAAHLAPPAAARAKPRAGLVLTGGGARAAYQVGVVKAVRDILGAPAANPFPILCGTSAGAINAATLAVFADDFNGAVERLLDIWQRMRCERIYRTAAWPIVASGARWLAAMMLLSRHNPVSLLDNNPLADIRNTLTISGVMFGGRWLTRTDLDAMLARGRRAINAP